MRFALSVPVLFGLFAFGCGAERPVFTEAPATTVTVPPAAASAPPRPADTASSDEDTNEVPLADDGMGGDVGTTPPPPSVAIAPSFPGAPRAVDPARDPRIRTHAPRQRALLVTELQGLTSLLASTSQTAPDRPNLVRRIAEDYAELARAGSAAAGGADPVTRAARTKAIDFYTQLEAFPSYAKLDEALYFKGLELEMNGDVTNARRTFYDVIRKSPASRFVSYSYFAFGEMFFDEAASDPSKNDLALQAYNEVLKQPGSPLAPESLLRSGQIAERKNDRLKALQFYKRLRQAHPGTSAAGSVPAWASRP